MAAQQPENDNHTLAMLALLSSPFLLTGPGRAVARKAFGHIKDAIIPARTAIVNSTKAIAPAEEAIGGIAKMMEDVAPKPKTSSFFDIMKGDVYGGEAPAMLSDDPVYKLVANPSSTTKAPLPARKKVSKPTRKAEQVKPKPTTEEPLPPLKNQQELRKWLKELDEADNSTMDDIMSSVVDNTYTTIHKEKNAPNTRAGVLNIALATLEGDNRFNTLSSVKRAEMTERVKRDIFATLPNVDK